MKLQLAKNNLANLILFCLSHPPLDWNVWWRIIGVAVIAYIVVEIEKWIRLKINRPKD